MANKALALVLENANGLAFLTGACWCYVGLAGVSAPLANVLAGVVLMAIGAVPTLVRRRRKP